LLYLLTLFFTVSEAPKLAPPPKKYTYDFTSKTDEEKKEELVSAMIDRMAERDQEPLPQDAQEGVADDEWVSNLLFYNKHLNAILFVHRMTNWH